MSEFHAYGFHVEGQPVPQGSKQGYVVGKRAVLVDSNKAALKPWRAAITEAARSVAVTGIEGPVALEVHFLMNRPKSVRRLFPHVKPDLDKLIRAICDGITDSGLWGDDSQVVRITASKTYSEDPGATVRILPL